MIQIVFEGGPFAGQELALAGKVPAYLMLIPGGDFGWTVPVVVGADFDDHWPGQSRYEIDAAKAESDGAYEGYAKAIYNYVEP